MTTPDGQQPTGDESLALSTETLDDLDDLDPQHDTTSIKGGAHPTINGSGC